MTYVINIHVAEEGGYWGEISALPGCYVQGETLAEMMADVPAATRSHLVAMKAFA